VVALSLENGAKQFMSFPAYPQTERQKQIITIAQELAETFAQRAAQDDWEGKFPFENYADLQRSGYLTLTVPREYGGWGADVLEATLAQYYLAQGCASTALVMGMHLTHIARLYEGQKDQSSPGEIFERICHAVVEDGAVLNTAVSEPTTGSPSRGGRPSTTARRQPDGSWRINGRKTYTTGSSVLKLIPVGCSIIDEADGHLPPLTAERGSFLVSGDAPGVRVEETWNSLAMRMSGSNDLILEDVHIESWAYMETGMPPGTAPQERIAAWGLPIAAVYLGIAQAARNEAIQFAQRRRPNSLDRPIASVPHIQEKVAKMELALLQSNAVLFGLAVQSVADPCSVPVSQFSAAKYLATNSAIEITDLAMRVVGGASLSLEGSLQRHYRDLRAGLHHPPMDDVTLAQLARDALEEHA
jgi:alkylation response protein AidB-like acyl-CoA dehydrogenase